MRYFMWNFAGREGDEIGDDWLGPSQWFEKVPYLISYNKARNNFFLIPFVLGFFGLYYQFVKDPKNAAVVGLLFILTGVALVIYLNSPPPNRANATTSMPVLTMPSLSGLGWQ